MGIRTIYLKFRRMIDWVKTFLWVTVILCLYGIGYGIYSKSPNTWIPLFGTLVAVFAIILMYREMNLKNRPYLHVDGIPKFIRDKSKTQPRRAKCEFAIKNSGTLPAYEVFLFPKLIINGKEVPTEPKPETEPMSIYPNSFISNTPDFRYFPETKIFWSITIRYEGPNKKRYHFYGEYEIKPAEAKATLIRTI